MLKLFSSSFFFFLFSLFLNFSLFLFVYHVLQKLALMVTLNQLIKNERLKFRNNKKSLILANCPQKKGICLKVYSVSPKKPNSAVRKIAKVKLSSGKIIIGYIPGEKHSLQEHSMVLIRGGRVKDLPGVHYHVIRGVYDLGPVTTRKTARSKYGKSKT